MEMLKTLCTDATDVYMVGKTNIQKYQHLKPLEKARKHCIIVKHAKRLQLTQHAKGTKELRESS